jgi:hypothetical protein
MSYNEEDMLEQDAEIDKYIKALDDSDVDDNEEALKLVDIKLKVKNTGNKYDVLRKNSRIKENCNHDDAIYQSSRILQPLRIRTQRTPPDKVVNLPPP